MRCFLTVISLLAVGAPVFAKEVTIHGFVTHVKSSSNFAIDEYNISRDNGVALDLPKMEGTQPPNFQPEDICVGTELEVTGDYERTVRGLESQVDQSLP